MGKERNHWIDCLKGIDIAFVALGHLLPGYSPMSLWLYVFVLPLFFMLTGIVSEKYPKQETWGQAVVSKAKSIMWPYFTFSLCVVILLAFTEGIPRAMNVLELTITLEGHLSLYYLPTLFIGVCVYEFIKRRKHKIPYLALTIAVILIGNVICNIEEPADINRLLHIFLKYFNILTRSMVGMVFIYLGAVLNRCLPKTRSIFSKPILVIVSLVMLAVGFILSCMNGWVDLHYSIFHNPLLYFAGAILTCLPLVVLAEAFDMKSRVLEFLGRNSLVIMITHMYLPLQAIYAVLIATGLFQAESILIQIAAWLIVLFLEVPIVCFINRWMRFLLKLPKFGKRNRKNEISCNK